MFSMAQKVFGVHGFVAQGFVAVRWRSPSMTASKPPSAPNTPSTAATTSSMVTTSRGAKNEAGRVTFWGRVELPVRVGTAQNDEGAAFNPGPAMRIQARHDLGDLPLTRFAHELAQFFLVGQYLFPASHESWPRLEWRVV